MYHFYEKEKLSKNFIHEVITDENTLAIAEVLTIHQLRYMCIYMPYSSKIYKNLLADIFASNKDGYVYSDSYDILQDVAIALLEYRGKTLDDLIFNKRYNKYETINKHILNLISLRLHYNYLECNMFEDIDNQDETPSNDISLDDEIQDYTKYDEIIAKLNLKPRELEILNCLMANMRNKDICKLFNLKRPYPCTLRYRLQKQINSWN